MWFPHTYSYFNRAECLVDSNIVCSSSSFKFALDTRASLRERLWEQSIRDGMASVMSISNLAILILCASRSSIVLVIYSLRVLVGFLCLTTNRTNCFSLALLDGNTVVGSNVHPKDKTLNINISRIDPFPLSFIDIEQFEFQLPWSPMPIAPWQWHSNYI